MDQWEKIGPISKYSQGNKWIIHAKGRPIALFKYNNNAAHEAFAHSVPRHPS